MQDNGIALALVEKETNNFLWSKYYTSFNLYFNVKDVFLYSNDSEKFPTDFSRKGLEAFFEAELKGSISTIKNLAEE